VVTTHATTTQDHYRGTDVIHGVGDMFVQLLHDAAFARGLLHRLPAWMGFFRRDADDRQLALPPMVPAHVESSAGG
jgi:hypothetical protein